MALPTHVELSETDSLYRYFITGMRPLPVVVVSLAAVYICDMTVRDTRVVHSTISVLNMKMRFRQVGRPVKSFDVSSRPPDLWWCKRRM